MNLTDSFTFISENADRLIVIFQQVVIRIHTIR